VQADALRKLRSGAGVLQLYRNPGMSEAAIKTLIKRAQEAGLTNVVNIKCELVRALLCAFMSACRCASAVGCRTAALQAVRVSQHAWLRPFCSL
jgi:hypothetical protein